MPPKKGDKGKEKNAPPQPEFVSLYAKRDPLPPVELPNTSDAEQAWKATKNTFTPPLPEWDDEIVNTTEWKPLEKDNMFVSSTFSSKALPQSFTKSILAWKRAPYIAEAGCPEEPEPQASLPPEPEEPPAPDPKAKAKADPKAKPAAKGKAVEEPVSTKKTTMEQFKECEPEVEFNVVSVAEFRSREAQLFLDDSMPHICQAIGSAIAIVAEHRKMIPRGKYLWELIYPQDEEGMPLLNPHGKYIVRLFLQGIWRQVLIDDVVPVGRSANPMMASHAPMLPSSATPGSIWPLLLGKALLKVFQADLKAPLLRPLIVALTGWFPFQNPLTWDALQTMVTSRPFCCLHLSSQIDVEAKEREAIAAASGHAEVESRPGGRKPAAPGAPVPSLPLGGGGGGANPPALPASLSIRLVEQPIEAIMHFLICEIEEEPRQLRLKSGTWRPVLGTPRKVMLRDVESEADEEEDDTQRGGRASDEPEESEHDEQNEEDEDDPDHPGNSARSPSGADGPQSSRSKDGADGEGRTGGEAEKAPENESDREESEASPRVIPWPEEAPESMLMKSELTEYVSQLVGGFWVQYDSLNEICDAFTTFVPSSINLLEALLDTTWADRKKPFTPPACRLLRIVLVNKESDDTAGLLGSSGGGRHLGRHKDLGTLTDDDYPSGPAWHRVSFMYEPLRPDPASGKSFSAAVSSGAPATCLLQAMRHWIPGNAVEGSADYVHLAVESDSSSNPVSGGGGIATRSIMLPPGEHWYLVMDDAVRAGATLSAHVDGSFLDLPASKAEFVEPAEALRGKKLPVVDLDNVEFPPQMGFSVWLKAEVVMPAEVANKVACMQLLSHVSDPALLQHLTVTFLRFEAPVAEEGKNEALCARWSVTTLVRSPLLRLMSLPLSIDSPAVPPPAPATGGYPAKGGPVVPATGAVIATGSPTQGGEERRVRYYIMLEASVPVPTKGGKYSLQLFLPPVDGVAVARVPTPVDQETDNAEDSSPLQLKQLKTTNVLRWSGSTAPNDKLAVLCERITVPADQGDVMATLRIEVAALPGAFLKARLVAQLPPGPEMRPAPPEGQERQPLVAGQPINPREYSGRRNWLKSCVPVAFAEGTEVVMMPHVFLAEGGTYILYVHLDPFYGPALLEGGSWTFEFFGSGDVELGAEKMEQDLEVLVRKSWEEPPVADQPDRPLRKNRASAARTKWLKEKGLYVPPPPVEGDDGNPPVPEVAETGKKGSPPVTADKKGPALNAEPAVPAEPPPPSAEEIAAQEALEAAVARVERATHTNKVVADFVHWHTTVPPVLTSEDPWTVAPDPSVIPALPATVKPKAEGVEGAAAAPAAGQEESAEKAAPEELPEEDLPEPEEGEEPTETMARWAARKALGTQGLAKVQRQEVAAAEERWAQTNAQMEVAKESNAAALADLLKFREDFVSCELRFLENRDGLRNGLQSRLKVATALKESVADADSAESSLQGALEAAEQAEVSIWDAKLMETAGQKLKFVRAFTTFKAMLTEQRAKEEEDRLTQPGQRNEFLELFDSLRDLLQELVAKSIPLAHEVGDQDPYSQAVDLLCAPGGKGGSEEILKTIQALTQSLSNLIQRREQSSPDDARVKAQRDALEGGLTLRLARLEALREAVAKAEVDEATLQSALEQATQAELGNWEATLLENAGQKLEFIRAFSSFKAQVNEQLEKEEEERFLQEGSREELATLLETVQRLLEELGAKAVPLPKQALAGADAEAPAPDSFQAKAAELIAAAEAAERHAAAAAAAAKKGR